MDNSIVLLLDNTAPIKNIINAIVDELDNKKVFVSSDHRQHDSAIEFPLDGGIAISYDHISDRDFIFLTKVLYKIASRYSPKEINLKNNKEYHFINVNDWEKCSLVTEDEWDNTDIDVDEFLVFTDPFTKIAKIVPEEDIDDLETKMNTDVDLAKQCTYYDFTAILDRASYDIEKPSFFISVFFWKRAKARFERDTSDALKAASLALAKLGLH